MSHSADRQHLVLGFTGFKYITGSPLQVSLVRRTARTTRLSDTGSCLRHHTGFTDRTWRQRAPINNNNNMPTGSYLERTCLDAEVHAASIDGSSQRFVFSKTLLTTKNFGCRLRDGFCRATPPLPHTTHLVPKLQEDLLSSQLQRAHLSSSSPHSRKCHQSHLQTKHRRSARALVVNTGGTWANTSRKHHLCHIYNV